MRFTPISTGGRQLPKRAVILNGAELEDHGYIGSAPPDPQRDRGRMLTRLVGLFMIAFGIATRWYNWHLLHTTGEFYVKATLMAPAGVAGGLLMLLRPDWVGRLRKDSPRAQKLTVWAVIAVMAVGGGIDFYLLEHARSALAARLAPPVIQQKVFAPVFAEAPAIPFLSKTYKLASFHRNKNPMWEFTADGESVNDWSTLFTVIDRPDASTREQLDRLAEGVLADYKSHGAKLLVARTMQDTAGVFNYMVAAFEEPARNRYELNFVKIAMGYPEAIIMIYGVRIADPADYRAKAKEYLDRNSSAVGAALGKLAAPEVRGWPQQPF